MTPDGRCAPARWATLVRERFPLTVHLPLILAFGGGNLVVVLPDAPSPPATGRLVATFLVTLLFFFRLRLFDELKDADTDRTEHPERPIPRGLVSAREARGLAAAGLVGEGLVTATLGWPSVAAWLGAALYSLLMYREFFCGPWLRPRLELYAVTHTLVAGALGLFVACAGTGLAPWTLPRGALVFILVNWSVFNVFEFARKTYGRDESDGRAETYSDRLGPPGAALLSLAWAVIAVFVAERVLPSSMSALWIWSVRVLLLGPPLLVSGVYVLRPVRRTARLYRGVYTVFLFACYAVLIAAYSQGGAGT